MKSVLSMFKSKDLDEKAVVKNENLDDDFQDYDYENSFEESEESNDVFEEFTEKVQSLLDEGAMALELAEQKTTLLERMDPSDSKYAKLVEEIKLSQAEARQSFDDAEFLIQRANEILENNAN